MTETRAQRIQKLLDELDLSARGASLAAGLNHRFVSDLMENEQASPREANVQKLAKALKTTVDWIERGVKPSDTSDPESAKIVSILPHLDQADRAKVEEYARLLQEQSKRKDDAD